MSSRPETVHDPERDGITLPLLRRAVAIGVPVLAICRGIQELNVALGGTLHQLVHEVAGRRDHRSKKGEPLDVRYGPAHTVALTPGGFFHTLTGATEILVNSLHAQGIDRLAEQLEIEAVAPDGQIEAVRGKASPGFCIGAQWHPEYKALENPVSRALFSHFGAACRARAAARAGRLAA
jgi:putative glutamine amidotransferase